MAEQSLDRLPGFRRRIRLVPRDGAIDADLEDDYHCMSITLRHRQGMVVEFDVDMERVPWTTCPGAPAVLRETFVGVPLAEVARRGMKRANCTHLHDLAVLCAAHADDDGETLYELVVTDPVGEDVRAEVRRNGTTVLAFAHRGNVLSEPPSASGLSLFKLREWIAGLPPAEAEAAKLLQWGTILAHGRRFDQSRHADVGNWPANCFTFQPGRREHTRHIGTSVDFSAGGRAPLELSANDGAGDPRP